MHEKGGTYTWSEALGVVCSDLTDASPEAGLATVISYARNFGIGVPVSPQKADYSTSDLNNLRILLKWWSLLITRSNFALLSKVSLRALVRCLSTSIVLSRPVPVLAIFCPSYKVGNDKIGFETTVGHHTSLVVDGLLHYLTDAENTGLVTQTEVYFSDLLLENLELLAGTSYRYDLDRNYQSFQAAFLNDHHLNISVQKLSVFDELIAKIGEAGVHDPYADRDPKLFDHVHRRNRIFYAQQLAWHEDRILNRTKILYDSYKQLGIFFRSRNPWYVIYWTESAYERAPMYSTGLPKAEPFPIIYPHK